MTDSNNTMTQARQLYQTVRMLRNRLGHEFAARQRGGGTLCPDLTFTQCNVVMAVQEMGELSLKELADVLHVSRPSASTMVDRLVEMGFLIREQAEVDRREVRIRLSEEGYLQFQQLEEEILCYITELLTKLGPAYSAQWCDVYSRVREIIEAEKSADTTPISTKDSLA